MEAGAQCLRHQLRRKNQLNAYRGSQENLTVPKQQYCLLMPGERIPRADLSWPEPRKRQCENR